ncbi:MAG: transporter substrate-binding domain-containing protein [Deltaproteobacteria bacterium]|jgi:ABC-type amino acid transport substrate-binding protein|nr:transporter substrate-binding domain-containing protein [Deltaproteobacteria bacterium]
MTEANIPLQVPRSGPSGRPPGRRPRGIPAASAALALAALAVGFLTHAGHGNALAQGLDRSRVYRVAVDESYPPFSFMDKSGRLTGFDAEISRALCAEMRVQCDVRGYPFADILPGVASGAIDVGGAGFAMTDERVGMVDFTDKYFRSTSIFIQYGSALTGSSPEAMAGKRIAVQKDTIQETYLRENYPRIASLSTFEDFEGVVGALRSGICDAAMVDGLPGFTFVKSDGGEGFDIAGDPLPLETVARMIVSKDLPALREEMNAAIQRIRANGVYDEINRKYFSFNVY